MLSPASPPGPALGPALREGLKLGPGPSPTFKARARPELVFLGPDPSLRAAKGAKMRYTMESNLSCCLSTFSCQIETEHEIYKYNYRPS